MLRIDMSLPLRYAPLAVAALEFDCDARAKEERSEPADAIVVMATGGECSVADVPGSLTRRAGDTLRAP